MNSAVFPEPFKLLCSEDSFTNNNASAALISFSLLFFKFEGIAYRGEYVHG